jgi:hypothetical protein
MVNFRWHKGSFEESMKTVVTIKGFDELYLLIKNSLSEFSIEVQKEDISINYYTFDNRISEESYIVTLKDYGVLGWTNSDIPKS